MDMKKVLVLFGLLGVFASGFGADSSAGVGPPLPSASGSGAFDDGPQTALKTSAELGSGKSVPLNVILLLVDGLYRSNVTAYLENQDAFPVGGFLQVCPVDNIHHSEASSCDCEEQLASSVASLLSWAQRIRGMSTSALYEMPNEISGPRARLIDRQRREAPRVLQIEPIIESEGTDIASKITDAFFRRLVNGLSLTQPRKPSVIHFSNIADLSSKVLKEFNSIPNKSGHLAVVRIGVDGLDNVLELFKRYVSSSKTLTVIMNSCPQNNLNSVPFFAGGISSERLSNAVLKRLHDLPFAIRKTIDDNDKQGAVDAENIKPTVILMSNELAARDHITGIISSGMNKRNKRSPEDAPAAAAAAAAPSTAAPADGAAPAGGLALTLTEDQKTKYSSSLTALDDCKKRRSDFKGNVTEPFPPVADAKNSHWESLQAELAACKELDDKNKGPRTVAESTMMIFTAVTAAITYAMKF